MLLVAEVPKEGVGIGAATGDGRVGAAKVGREDKDDEETTD